VKAAVCLSGAGDKNTLARVIGQDALMSSTRPQPPEGAVYDVGFRRLHGDEVWSRWFVFSPAIEDAKREALDQLRESGQDPDDYDTENPQVLPITR
jgi:hypothetical protein